MWLDRMTLKSQKSWKQPKNLESFSLIVQKRISSLKFCKYIMCLDIIPNNFCQSNICIGGHCLFCLRCGHIVQYIYILRQYVAVEQPATNRRVHYIQPWPTTVRGPTHSYSSQYTHRSCLRVCLQKRDTYYIQTWQ